MLISDSENKTPAQDDAFDKVRKKDNLKTKGEKLLDKK